MNYARVVDIHQWYRDWGIDWERLNANFDLVGIRAGVGDYKDELLEFFVDKCNEIGRPYFTYHIPTAERLNGYSPEEQAAIYLGWPGVSDAVRCFDIEAPFANGTYMVNKEEAIRYITALGNSDRVIWYSNQANIAKIQWPVELAGYRNWIATYYYRPGTEKQFETFEQFLAVYVPERLPMWIRGTIYAPSTIMWQFTAKGKAFQYLSIPPNGVRDCDLSLSTIEKDRLLEIFTSSVPEPPQPPGDDVMGRFRCAVQGQFQNVRSDHVVNTSNVVGKIYNGEIVDATETWSDPLGNVWVKIKPTGNQLLVPGWAAIVYSDDVYLVSV